MATAMVNGVELYYEVTGTGDCLVLTHGSWTDGASWEPAVARLAERYQVVVWDRRGHSRSRPGDGPGSRAEDAADLAGLIEHVSGDPVHVAGNSYGANVTLTMLTARPDLVATAAVHESPLWGLLEGTRDQVLLDELSAADADLAVVRDLINSGAHRDAAEHFIEHVALGRGTWDQLPEPFRAVLEANAPTYLDELADDTALSIDTAALAATDVPLLLTHGTESPKLFPAVIAELETLVPTARVEVLEGAGHIPHATHPDEWTARLTAFHEQHTGSPHDTGDLAQDRWAPHRTHLCQSRVTTRSGATLFAMENGLLSP
jgi:pimeloyl-ACP methyl ester carboxylesterase